MDLTELIQSRRTVHSFKPDPIEDKTVEEALRLSLWAPNHRGTWPWKYFYLGASARGRIADLAVELRGAKEAMSDVKKQALRDTLTQPSHLILLAIQVSEPKQMHEDYATLACSVQIASMVLWAKGVGTKWSTSGFFTHAKTYDTLNLSPTEVRLEGALFIGVPRQVPAPPARPDLAEHLTRID